MQRLSPRPFRKRPASETETEGRIFFLEVSNETKWLLEPCGAYVKSISRQSYTSQVLQTFEKRCSPKPFGQTKNALFFWHISLYIEENTNFEISFNYNPQIIELMMCWEKHLGNVHK